MNDSKTTVRIAFLGDLFFGEDVPELSPELNRVLGECDAVLANLESPICDLPHTSEQAVIDAAKREGFDKIFLRSSPGCQKILAAWNVKYLSLANNHVFDCGAAGLASTIELLGKAGVCFAGAGNTLWQASKPMILNLGGISFGVIAATEGRSTSLLATGSTPGCNTLEMPGICDQVKALKQSVEHVIVLPHWGTCGPIFPEGRLVDLGELLLDAGASLVVGQHSHTLQGCRRRDDGRMVCYSLGNFYFGSFDYDGRRIFAQGEETRGSILTVEFSTLQRHQLRDSWQFTRQDSTTVALDAEASRVLEFEKRSAPYKVSR